MKGEELLTITYRQNLLQTATAIAIAVKTWTQVQFWINSENAKGQCSRGLCASLGDFGTTISPCYDFRFAAVLSTFTISFRMNLLTT